MSDTLLKVRKLSVELLRAGETKQILKDISLDLSKGEVLGIIGESGSGKTVLCNALVNWVSPPLHISGGTIKFEGQDLLVLPESQMSRVRGNKIGYIGSDAASSLDPTTPVGKQIVEKLRSIKAGISATQARARVLEFLEAVRIPEPNYRFNEYPFQYSGGMMQRAMIVDALVGDPAFLVADNITQSVDVTVAVQIIRLLKKLREQFGTTIVFVSSSLPVVREIADNVLVLYQGEMVEKNRAEDLVASPTHHYTKELIKRIPLIWNQENRVYHPDIEDINPVLSIKDVFKTFRVRRKDSFFGVNEVQAVRGVSFDILPGENFGLVGESGCGKSTLSRLMTWIDEPDQGSISFQGVQISKMSARERLKFRSRFQLVLQDPYNSIPSHQSIGRIIAEPLLIHNDVPKSEIRDRVLASMQEVGLSQDHYNRLPGGLSAGQRQRINIARAMVLKPKFLILDETLSSLDQTEQLRLLELFECLQAEHRFTYMFITHDMALVRRVCTRIAVMYLGKIVELTDNHSLFFNPQHPYTKALLSAVPTVEEKPFITEEVLLEGEPPSPINLPPGCSFANRCPSAFEPCKQKDPPNWPTDNGGISACHLLQVSTKKIG